MKNFTLLLLMLTCTAAAQTTSIKEAIQTVANNNQLELCFSKDLVSLSDSIALPADSLTLEKYLQQIAISAQLDIKQIDQNLIVTSLSNKTLLLSGKIIDDSSGEEVPFAHILQRDWGTGTVTNQVGQFDINIPKVLSGLELEFSCLGYSDTTITIPQGDSLNLSVKLRAKPFNLNEVLVLPNGNTAKELVIKASKKIKRNYHRKTIQMEAFYRQTAYRDSTYVRLVEGALLIEDKGINSPMSTTKIKVEEMRRSTNYLIPRDAKWDKAFEYWEKIFGHRNVFYSCYSKNAVRNYRSDWWYRPLADFKDFDYEFEGAMWMDTMKVYKIKYEDHIWNEKLFGPRPIHTERKSFDGGYIYINASDYAIVKIDYIWQHFKNHNMHSYYPDGIMNQSTRSYQKIDGKYYLKYIKGTSYPQAKSFIYENPDAEDKDLVIKHRQHGEEVLLITNIVSDKKLQDRIRLKEKLARDEKTLEKNYPYNPDFWANYNMIKLKPLSDQAIEDLEWEKTLDIQFNENSADYVENK